MTGMADPGSDEAKKAPCRTMCPLTPSFLVRFISLTLQSSNFKKTVHELETRSKLLAEANKTLKLEVARLRKDTEQKDNELEKV